MNTNLIIKVIKTNGDVCPDLLYNNPLLDKTVTRALSKNFVNILNVSRDNSNFNKNLRHSLLTYIRNVCQVQPKEHIKTDENVMNLVNDVYLRALESKSQNLKETDKCLDIFLIKEMKSMGINSIFDCDNADMEVIQALMNLNEHSTKIEFIYEHILHWNLTDKNLKVLNKLWNEDCSSKDWILDSISIKIKSTIERILLNKCHEIISQSNSINLDEIFEDTDLNDLGRKCSKSPHCFQICYGILNSVFMKTNFNLQLAKFINCFILKIKHNCVITVSSLYHKHLRHIVIILDTDLNKLPCGLQERYSDFGLKYLMELHDQSEDELIMLLSHYPRWFEIYTNTLKQLDSGL